MGGGLAVLGGTTILYGQKKVTDQAKDLSHELNGARGHRRPPYRPLVAFASASLWVAVQTE